jgi:hypothetical protein
MTRLKPWTATAVGLIVAFAIVVFICAAVAQAPAKAPVPVERRNADDANVPPMPGNRDRGQRARERAEVVRRMWTDTALLSGRGPSAVSMMVEGEHVYVLYGPYLLQLSVDGLQVEAKVDLREALGLTVVDREVRERAREAKEARRARAAVPEAETGEEAVEQ